MKRNVWILNLLILGIIPLSSAKVFLITLDNIDDRDLETNSGIKSSHESLIVRKPQVNPHNLIQKLIGTLSQKQVQPNKTKNKCIRLFGSIYGAKNQRLKCLEKLKSIRMRAKKYSDKTSTNLVHSGPHYEEMVYQDTEYPRVGFTKKIQKRFDLSTSNPNEFSSDYIDFIDLRSKQRPKIHWDYYRKSNPHVIEKRNMYVEISDLEDNKDLKRFQVIGNKKKGYIDSDSDDSESVEEKSIVISDSDSSMEQEKRGKKQNFGKDSVEASAERENNIEFYIQGNKVLSANSNGAFRRRLPTFLPKRYHWEEDDIHNLGYYWFNGPQGRYPYYAVRP